MNNFLKMSSVLALSTFSMIAFASKNDLPNWIDHSKETIKIKRGTRITVTNPPSMKFKTPAEYEPVSAVVIGWAGFEGILQNIAKNVLSETKAEVWVLGAGNKISKPSFPGLPGGIGFGSSIPNDPRVKKFNCPLDTSWMRDYGPFGIIEGVKDSRGIAQIYNANIDPIYRHYAYRVNDDAAPECIANTKKMDNFKLPLIYDGGNFLIDSKGNLFMTKRTYVWNNNKTEDEVNKILKAYFNVKSINAIDYAGYPGEPADGTGHIDMFVKLLNDETVLIADSKNEPFKTAIDKAVAFFTNAKTPSGGKYKILRTPGFMSGRTWYTYTNSLIVNGVVLMPAFSRFAKENTFSQKVYESAGFKVKGIISDDSIVQGGSIHCLTQTVPAATR